MQWIICSYSVLQSSIYWYFFSLFWRHPILSILSNIVGAVRLKINIHVNAIVPQGGEDQFWRVPIGQRFGYRTPRPYSAFGFTRNFFESRHFYRARTAESSLARLIVVIFVFPIEPVSLNIHTLPLLKSARTMGNTGKYPFWHLSRYRSPPRSHRNHFPRSPAVIN